MRAPRCEARARTNNYTPPLYCTAARRCKWARDANSTAGSGIVGPTVGCGARHEPTLNPAPCCSACRHVAFHGSVWNRTSHALRRGAPWSRLPGPTQRGARRSHAHGPKLLHGLQLKVCMGGRRSPWHWLLSHGGRPRARRVRVAQPQAHARASARAAPLGLCARPLGSIDGAPSRSASGASRASQWHCQLLYW